MVHTLTSCGAWCQYLVRCVTEGNGEPISVNKTRVMRCTSSDDSIRIRVRLIGSLFEEMECSKYSLPHVAKRRMVEMNVKIYVNEGSVGTEGCDEEHDHWIKSEVRFACESIRSNWAVRGCDMGWGQRG